MPHRSINSRVLTILALSLTAVFLMSASGEAGPPGLNADALEELEEAGVFKYLESDEFDGFTSTSSDWGVWTQHTYDKD
mgnify:FL=1